MTTTNHDFIQFPKMARLMREAIITEKIDGTNAQIIIAPLAADEPNPVHSLGAFDHLGHLHYMAAGRRTRWITPQNDNHGFARWCADHFDQLKTLGPGRHFGEWWGSGIQRGYGLTKGEKRLSLFNVVRWCRHGETPKPLTSSDPTAPVRLQDVLPPCVGLVPVLHRGTFSTDTCRFAIQMLRDFGSRAAPGFMDPEGIVVFHTAANAGFKLTLHNDGTPKSLQKQ